MKQHNYIDVCLISFHVSASPMGAILIQFRALTKGCICWLLCERILSLLDRQLIRAINTQGVSRPQTSPYSSHETQPSDIAIWLCKRQVPSTLAWVTTQLSRLGSSPEYRRRGRSDSIGRSLFPLSTAALPRCLWPQCR